MINLLDHESLDDTLLDLELLDEEPLDDEPLDFYIFMSNFQASDLN